MTTPSEEAKLSKSYTNRCVRSTCITLLDNTGHEARHIMTVSGHKEAETIQSYSNKTTKAQKHQVSETLSSAIIESPPKISKPNQTESEMQRFKAQPSASVQVNEAPNFNLNLRDLLELSEQEEKDLLKNLLMKRYQCPSQ